MADNSSEVIASTTAYCEPCTEDGISESATKYCPECKEFLCSSCTTRHKTQKASKHHTLVLPEEVDMDDKDNEDITKLDNEEVCEPCNESDKSSVAKSYCKQCDEKLCEDCAHSHTRQKLTKSHELIKIESIRPTEKYCDPCSEGNVSVTASKYCNTCEEHLCQRCIKIHLKQKLTKRHKLVDISEVVSGSTQMCEPCLDDEVKAPAVMLCLFCKEFICENCTKRHKLKKVTKNHQLIHVDKIPKPKPILCTMCLGDEENELATMSCNDCNEKLCENCVIDHRKFKLTKTHILVETSNQNDDFIKDIRPCDECEESGDCNIALKSCQECKENLCEECCIRHSRQKITRRHNLLDFTERDIVAKQQCGPCSSEEITVNADHFCQECDEYLCGRCCKRHKIQKASRNHEVISAEKQTSLATNKFDACEACKLQDEQVQATCYCMDCADPELLCEPCAKQHKRQKPFREHKISSDIAAFHATTSTEAENKVGDAEDIALKKENPEPKSCNEPEITSIPADLPGKPSASDIKADSITLRWDKAEHFNEGAHYQIRYKDLDNAAGKWRFHLSEIPVATMTMTDMKANTKYIFQVRVVHEDGEGPYSEQSDPIITANSPAARIVDFSTQITKGPPPVYAVPTTENRNARNMKAKTKKFDVGSPPCIDAAERIIMLVGATGTGKSTLVDGIVNYVMGVNWNDNFRFSIIDMEDEERAREKNQALSQTEWITCYTINPEKGSRLDYKLTIIDTPGFGDTRGLQRDHQIVNQIRELFSEKGQKGVVCIDAVCFLIKAPDARLTATQKYIFHSIMSLFGHDIENNICTLVTFADGMEPPVLAALKEADLPFGKHFIFNNSGLFTKNVDLDGSSLSPMFWEMGCKSFRSFFDFIQKMETKSLQLTKEVLEERLKLEVTIQSLQPRIAAGLSKIDELRAERKLIEQHKTDIEANKNFEYEVSETRQIKSELPPGINVTNCLHCHITCHNYCGYANDEDKKKCCAMDSKGNCTVCDSKCRWDQHANTPYVFEYKTETIKKTYAEKLAKYKKAGEEVLSQKQVVERMTEELYTLEDAIGELVTIVKESNERLKEIALRPNPLSMVDHIDIMIEAENHEKKAGYQQRIGVLTEFRRTAEIGKDIARFSEAASKTIREVHATTGTKQKEKKKPGLSQTEWITCYTINPEESSRLDYKLTIIDTPGFGDTRGLQRDHQIADQIRQLFTEKGQRGVVCIDAVCFLIKAPDARWTAAQRYILQYIMSLLGHDIQNNICTLVTFADGMEPPVLASLKESHLPFGEHFIFNNSGLFMKNVDLGSSSLSPTFWEMSCKGFRSFFDFIQKMKTKSLLLTKTVHEERLKLEITVQSLKPQIAAGLSKIDELRGACKCLEQRQYDKEANKNFEYEVSETRQIRSELPPGINVTNCLHCHITCHKRCDYSNDEDKKKCTAMDSAGNCTVCDAKCRWDHHVNTPYVFEYNTVTVKKTYAEKLAKYKKASEEVLRQKQVVERLADELYALEDAIGELVTIVKESNERLKEIALRPNPLSMVDHINTMIEAENHEKKAGYQQRIGVLTEFRRTAEIGKDIARFSEAASRTRKEAGTSPLSMVNHIDTMIEAENYEKKAGYQQRVDVLTEFRRKAKIGKDIARFSEAASRTRKEVGTSPLSMVNHIDTMIEAENYEKKAGYQQRVDVLTEFRRKAKIGKDNAQFSEAASRTRKKAGTSPLSMVDHIDTMIEAENHEKKEGYQQRVDVLTEFRRKAKIGKDNAQFSEAASRTRKEAGTSPLSMVNHIDTMIEAENHEKKEGYQQRVDVLTEFRRKAKIGKDNAQFSEAASRTRKEAGTSPLSMVDHIDTMIEAENHEKKEGYQQRVAVLVEFRRKAKIGKDNAQFSEAASRTRKEAHAVTGTKEKKKRSPWQMFWK